ncbi:Aldehyde/histidinol dehydrogenase [Thamnocephalis sphaerospora]|uniref:Aldehyde/histidinol dehydrogenase n=1 Tax=Thamnocephalis sphaerospora TaxID=78915 RepID=A0A4P9XS37_9FUNG|nr:Aldehyde/histidinol dehydrogenase [Thamnocephalis sphaerospora]|eukprot:RKP08341.1 Aldehyde/histidinol dehydrogenase [Thamnocephalis sphaerospora]
MSTTIPTLSNFVGGQFEAPRAGVYLDSFNPATGRAYARVPDSDADDVNAAVTAAQAAFRTWSRTTPEQRATLLERVADLLTKRLEEFAAAESRDQGKPVGLARMVDIPRAIHNFRYFAGHTKSGTGSSSGALSYTHRWPVGVAALISPWNLPLYLLTWKIAPCLAAGCTCVCKPSEITSMTAYMLCSVLKDAGVPDGVVNMVFGTGTATGERIISDSARFFKKLSLELGGKNANIVFADCDFDQALSTSVRSSFTNQGEVCLCGSRIFVQRAIYDRFVDALAHQAGQLKVGDPRAADTNLGALVSREHMEKVLGYIQLAREEGGRIHCGGERQSIDIQGNDGGNDGWFVPPTIITNVSPTGRVMQEEIFGPVVTVTPFDTEAEAIGLANDVPYGLSATVWTENGKRQRRVAEALHVGTVWVNCWMVRDLHMPFGGCKQSGLGREGGTHSLEFYTEVKTVCLSD